MPAADAPTASSPWDRAREFPVRKIRTLGWTLELEGKVLLAIASSDELAPWLRDRNQRPDHLYRRVEKATREFLAHTLWTGQDIVNRLELIHPRCKEFAEALPAHVLGKRLVEWANEDLEQLYKCAGMPPEWSAWYENVALRDGGGYPQEWRRAPSEEPVASAADVVAQPAAPAPAAQPSTSKPRAESSHMEHNQRSSAGAAPEETSLQSAASTSAVEQRASSSEAQHARQASEADLERACEVLERVLTFPELRAWLLDDLASPMPIPKDFKKSTLCFLLNKRSYYDPSGVAVTCRKTLRSLDKRYRRDKVLLSARAQELPTAQWDGEDKAKLGVCARWVALWHDQVALPRRERHPDGDGPLAAALRDSDRSSSEATNQ